ncbi:hypothetical protein MAPG_06209 [Magnaporthiopsis poae ATCC 64411]|uniref:Zn(2)-C6 fungal-type domain-containing protein n=1 Tax=Magnaporthiopsis poae (strain ATCC 64411 / 73-15) TaxID=644358 RepID=A0A0C4E1E9_MAGP6|nr:hypothetical protein MAPG_06209 [Magnaporthiopsis poae ATCC 64411]
MEPVTTPTGTPIRRACNRCHAQKLSCRRIGDEPCERCIRLKTECKSSPSLRYRKQQPQPQPRQKTQQSQHHLAYLGRQAHDVMAENAHHTSREQPGILASLGRRASATVTSGGLLPEKPCMTIDDLGDARNTNQPHHASICPGTAEDDTALSMVGFAFGIDTRLDPLFSSSSPGEGNHNIHPSASIEHMAHAASDYSPRQGYGSTGISYPFPQPTDCQPAFPLAPSHKRHQQGQNQHRSQGSLQPQAGSPPGTLEAVGHVGPLSPQRRSIPDSITPRRVAHHSAWLGLMSDLNRETWELSLQVPHRGPLENSFGVHSYTFYQENKAGSDDQRPFPLDQMFGLSRRLLEALRIPTAGTGLGSSPSSHGGISAGDSSPPSPPSLDQAAFAGGAPWWPGEAGTGLSTATPAAPVDSGSVLLALSTYVRLIDLYHRVFQLVDEEISSSSRGGGQLETFKLCTLPDISLGGIYPVAPSPVLQMTVTVRVAEEFLDGLRAEMDMLGSDLVASCPVTAWTQSPASARNSMAVDAGLTAAILGNASISFAAAVQSAMFEVKVQEARIRQGLGAIKARLERS